VETAELSWTDLPPLARPILVVALEGLFDAAGAATAAATHLTRATAAVTVATIDPEDFFDFQQRRPEVAIVDGGLRQVRWPAIDCVAVPVRGGRHDLLVLSGVEPHLRWRTFVDLVGEIALRAGAEMVVTLGAMVGMAPHTRPLGVVASAANTALAQRLGLARPSYQGPTGVAGVINDRLDRIDLPVMSLRVSVPHYVPGAPNPEATRSLLRRLELITGTPTNHEHFDRPADAWRRQVDAAVADDNDLSTYVRHLEVQVDRRPDLMPSGDELANQLEAFLREHRGE
jgi:hypothetical protein